MTEWWEWKRIVSNTWWASALILIVSFLMYLIGNAIGGFWGAVSYLVIGGAVVSLVMYFNNKYLINPFEKEEMIRGTLKDYATSIGMRQR